MNPLLKTLAALAIGSLGMVAHAEELKVMTSGGFTAAYKLLGAQYATQSGDTLDTILGPSMGKAPEADSQPPGPWRTCRRGDHGRLRVG